MKSYILNRAGRALVASGIAYTATEQIDVLPVAATEIASVVCEINYFIPLFGDFLWLILLYPTRCKVYNEFFSEKKSEHAQERTGLLVLLTCIVITNIFKIY